MRTLHPIMAQALAPWMPRAEPTCPLNMVEAIHQFRGFRLVCHFDYQPAERQTHWEPGCPESIELCAAYIGAVDVLEMIPDSQREIYEQQALDDMVGIYEYERDQRGEA